MANSDEKDLTVIDYGSLNKKVTFQENDYRQASLQLRLRQDGLTQSKFFRHMVSAYLTNDDRILSCVAEISNLSKAKKKKLKKLKDGGEELVDDLGLSEKQIENLFDLIAQEHPDL